MPPLYSCFNCGIAWLRRKQKNLLLTSNMRNLTDCVERYGIIYFVSLYSCLTCITFSRSNPESWCSPCARYITHVNWLILCKGTAKMFRQKFLLVLFFIYLSDNRIRMIKKLQFLTFSYFNNQNLHVVCFVKLSPVFVCIIVPLTLYGTSCHLDCLLIVPLCIIVYIIYKWCKFIN